MLRNCLFTSPIQKTKKKTNSEIVKLEMFLLYFKAKQQAQSYLVTAKHLEIQYFENNK